MTYSRKILVSLVLTALVSPLAAHAQFSRQGIFGCSRNAAALSGSVGAFSATGGVYVPVADYTVELNTGTLVYLECVLRGIVDRESESVTASLATKIIQAAVTGNDGGPMFRSNPDSERLVIGDRAALREFQNYQESEDAVMRETGGSVLRTAAKDYMDGRFVYSDVNCPYDVDLTVCRGPMSDLREEDRDLCVAALTDARCSAVTQPLLLIQAVYGRVAQENADVDAQLEQGGGFYSRTHIDAEGRRIIDTPSSIVQAQTEQALTSGFRRVENANNIDQMIGALYAGLGTQALTGSGGLLTGLTTAIGSGASYLSQMTAESNAGLRNAAANAALGILAAARNVENQYFQVVSAIANSLTNAISQLRSMERQCWDLIIYNTQPAPAKHVCTAPPVDGRCTGVSGAQLTIATSTQFSQAVINGQITPVATQAVQNVQRSQTALTLIDSLIRDVSNTQSLDAQRLALVQLDQLVSQGRLHVAADVTNVQQQQSAVADAMAQLITNTKTLWADDADPNRGWCNVANQAVIDFWDARWR